MLDVPVERNVDVAASHGIALMNLYTAALHRGDLAEAKGYLELAAASDTLNVRTMAENLLRTLSPQLTASTETTP